MLRPERLFHAVALPYELITRNAVWERHCARMAAELPEGARLVLDVGCGPGNSTAHLRASIGAGAIGLDPAAAMLKRARRRDGALRLVRGDAAALPVRDGVLDAVTLHSVLYLLPDRAVALREIRRVLRPGGRAVVFEPHKGNRTAWLRTLPTPHWALTALLWRTMGGLYGPFTPASLAETLRSAGLRVLKIDEALDGLGLLGVAER
jgi:ubiquinone/menaquinone biosynthesis C-methylase UbiE